MRSRATAQIDIFDPPAKGPLKRPSDPMWRLGYLRTSVTPDSMRWQTPLADIMLFVFLLFLGHFHFTLSLRAFARYR